MTEQTATTDPTPPPTATPKKRWPTEFGAFVRARREALGMTQQDVGTLVNDARASIANVELGGRPPYEAHDRLRALAAALQTEPEALIRLAETCRADYSLPGSGPGVTTAHRELALVLEAGWGSFPDAVLDEARGLVDKAKPVEPSTSSEPSPFGAWLLRTRLTKNVAQSGVAKAMGIARSYVSMVENGEKGASFPDEAVIATAELLGADPDEVRALVALSRQFYKLDSRLGEPGEVSAAHRQFAAAVVSRWHTMPAKTLAKLRTMLAGVSVAHS